MFRSYSNGTPHSSYTKVESSGEHHSSSFRFLATETSVAAFDYDNESPSCLDETYNTVHVHLKFLGKKLIYGMCFLLIFGTMLIIVGSLADATDGDERLAYIGEYNTLVETWNGADGAVAFEGLDFQARCVRSVTSGNAGSAVFATTVDGSSSLTPVALTAYDPQDFPATGFPDTVERPEKESFKQMDKGIAYKVELTRDTTTYMDGFISAQTSLTLSGAGLDNTFEFESVIRIPGRNLTYNWFVAESSQPSPITCKAPNTVYDAYPDTRFHSVPPCEEWCVSNYGVWSGTDATCYPTHMATGVDTGFDTGCCTVPETYAGLKQISFVATCTSKTACTITTGSTATGGSMNAPVQFANSPYITSNYDPTVGGMTDTDYPTFIYANMGTSIDWRASEPLDITIRSSNDPYYSASKIYNGYRGCVSGTDKAAQLYIPLAYKTDDQCFGSGQKAGSGMVLIVLGALLLSPFGFMFLCIVGVTV